MGRVKGNCLQQVNVGLGRSGREERWPEGPCLLLEPLQVSTDRTTALKAPKGGKKKIIFWNMRKWRKELINEPYIMMLFCHDLESDTAHQDRIKRKKVKMLDVQSCPALCNPMDCSPPDSSVHGILQARIPEQVAIPFSRESSPPRDQTPVSCITHRFFTVWAIREAQNKCTSNRGARGHDLLLTPHTSQFNQHTVLRLGEAPHTRSPAKGWVPTQCVWSPPALQQWAGRTAGHMDLDCSI